MPDTVQKSYDYAELLTEIIKSMPKKLNLNLLQKRTRKKLAQLEPDAWRGYLESALLENLSTFFFETDDDGNVIREAAVMAKERDVHKELLVAAAHAVDTGDADTARFLLQALDDMTGDEEITELQEEVQMSPYHRLPMIEDQSATIGPWAGLSWIRLTVDRANHDPNWVKYCKLHRAPHVGPLTWDFPILPHEDAQDVLRTIKDETGYSPRWYEQLDLRREIDHDLPGRPFLAETEDAE